MDHQRQICIGLSSACSHQHSLFIRMNRPAGSDLANDARQAAQAIVFGDIADKKLIDPVVVELADLRRMVTMDVETGPHHNLNACSGRDFLKR